MKRPLLKPILIITIIIIAITSIATGIIFLTSNTDGSDNIEEVIIDIPGSEPPYNFNYSWIEDNPYIAHAFGGILGNSYTNSYEAFLLNYQLGHRIFEVDFSITDDGKTVSAHDAGHWLANSTIPPSTLSAINTTDDKTFTYDNFMSSLWYDKYHPIDLTTLFQLMQEYPDIYIVTDTKYFDKEHVEQQFTAFRSIAETIDSSLLDRFIIQIYKPEMLDYIMEIYPWKSVIYTLYANGGSYTIENVIEFANQTGVKFITIPDIWLTEDISKAWLSSDLHIAVHTVNHLTRVNELHSLGITTIYTDFLLP